ncbi:MAG: CbiQ family ECF transporter T component [Lautropia sp.]|nr:CbiQ family ECF transporter T component [Lautropia sp.]
MGSLYSEHPTWLHRLGAGFKLGLMAVLGTLLFWLDTPLAMGVAGLGSLVLWISLGKATKPAHRLMVSVLIAASLVAAFHLWMGRPELAFTSTVRLACASCLGMALTVTTRPAALITVLEKLLGPLRLVGVEPSRVSLQLALMMRFTEHFFVQWKKLDDAYRLRTGKAGGLRLIAPLTVQMLQTARRVADAIYARLGG